MKSPAPSTMAPSAMAPSAMMTVILFAAGCAVAPPPAPDPVPAPRTWTAEAAPGEVAEEDWWAGFDDPELSRLIAAALAANRDLAAAAARVEAAAAEARIAGAPLAPQLALGLDGGRSKRNFVGFPIPGSGGSVLSTTTTTFSSGLNVSWEADLWGRLRAGEAAAAAGFAAARAELAAVRLSLSGQTAKAWFGLVEASLQGELARGAAASRKLTREQIERRYRAGIRGPLDLRLARSAEAAAAALVAQRRRQRDAAARRLDLLLSRYPGGEPPGPGATLPPLPPPAPAGLPSEILGRRPDLVAAERRLAAAGFRVRQARAALYPALRLTGSAGSLSDEVTDLLDSDFSVWSLAASILQPLFQGGRLRAGVDLGEARYREAANLYAQTVLRAFSEVETALAAERLLRGQATALETAARESAAAERLAQDRYRRGVGDYLAVLAAQVQALDSASQLLAVRRALLDSRIDLHLALGGGFDAAPPAAGMHSSHSAIEPMP